MTNSSLNSNSDSLIQKILSSSKTIAMVGVSSIKKDQDPKIIKRKPSIIVMKYLQEFGYKVIPVNPSVAGKQINGEIAVEKLNDIKIPVDIVNVFRPSKETPPIAEETVKINAKVFWLQYGIKNEDAESIVSSKYIIYVSNRCIKQEYQRLFLKVNPVFAALKK